jgi:hypothetical protein
LKKPLHNWRDNFIQYRDDSQYYIYCDVNASYASVHQFLEDGFGKPCIVANGNLENAGASLAISYEARGKISRGASLKKAKAACKGLIIYESCLPLYELYAEICDYILEFIIPKSSFYRGSCDEVIIKYEAKNYPYKKFWSAIRSTLDFIKEKTKQEIHININKEQEAEILSLPSRYQAIYAIAYLIRDCFKKILGLPISIAIAPSICLSKSLVDIAKPKIVNGKRAYHTFHDAICFPHSREKANQIYRCYQLSDLCGLQTIARRLEGNSIKTVSHVQDYYDLESTILLAKNKHLGKVAWFMAHGRDDVLSGYLTAIKERK